MCCSEFRGLVMNHESMIEGGDIMGYKDLRKSSENIFGITQLHTDFQSSYQSVYSSQKLFWKLDLA